MEKAQIEAPKPSKTLFPLSRRRSHLKSDTYFTLVQILSHCYAYEKSSSSPTAQVVPQELNPGEDYGSGEVGQVSGKEVCESFESVGPDSMVPPNLTTEKETILDESYGATGVQNRGFSDAQHGVIDEIERIMAVEEYEDSSKQMDVMFDESAKGIGLQNERLCKEKVLMEELEHIVKGSKETVHENSVSSLMASLDQNQSIRANAVAMNTQEEYVACQEIDMDRPWNAQKNSEPVDMSLDENEIGEFLDPSENSKNKSLSLKTNSLHTEEHKMQRKDVDLEKSVSSSRAMNVPHPVTDNAGIKKGEFSSQKISQTSGLSLDKDMICGPAKLSENAEKESSLLKTDVFLVNDETHPSETELKKSIYKSDSLNSPQSMIEEGDIEEGEISGDCGIDDKSPDVLSEDATVSQVNNVDGLQVSLDLTNRTEFCYDELNGASRKSFRLTSVKAERLDNAKISREGGPEESNRNEILFGPEMDIHEKPLKVKIADRHVLLLGNGRNEKKGSGAKDGVDCPSALHRHILEKNITNCDRIIATEEEDNSSCKKRKRGPPSKEKKAKKKQKERKRRAEKNRELGVKRLKLYPVSIPKPVTYCRHFLKGRCHQGDKCNFSHDTVPLTKSTPCCYFARNSCMKGDDCPFDHQLSRYPCDNYVKGFCSRGDTCMFSHEIPTNKDSTAALNECKPELKSPSSPGNTNIKKQLNITGSSLQNDAWRNSVGAHPCTNRSTLVKPPALAPKGINRLLTAEKSQAVCSSKLKQGSSSPSGNEGAKFGNQATPSALNTFLKSNEVPQRTSPCGVPKGINFLSFGKSPLDDTASKKVASLHSDGDSAAKLSLLDRLNSPKDASSSLNNGAGIIVGNQTSPGASKMVQNLDGMLKKTQPATTPQGLNLASFANASADESSRKRKTTFLQNCNTVIDRVVLEGQTACNKSQNSNAISSRLPTCVLPLGPPSDRVTSVNCKVAPDSAQKALSLTLFAAKYGSKLKMRESVSPLSLGPEGKDTAGNIIISSQNDMAKASKILNFLSGSSSKTKL